MGIARRFHLPDLLIGATVVSVGTTLPEVMISASSALGGHGEIAYGNAIGSIICNAALVAAITIAVRPGKADAAALRLPVSFFFIAAVFYAAVAYTTGTFSRWVGVVLLALFAAYMAAQVASARRAPAAPRAGEAPPEAAPSGSLAVELVRLALSAALIAVGANLMVDNGVVIAAGLGVPESVIALTVVALGTSLPELVTAITSLVKGHGGAVPGQRHRGQPVQSGAGERRLGGAGPLRPARRFHHRRAQRLSGAGPAGGFGGHGAAGGAAFVQGPALPLAGCGTACHLRGLLRGAVQPVTK